MKQELQNKLFEKYPKIFRQKDLSMNETCMCWGIECGDGWYWLIDNLCSQLQWDIDHNSKKSVIKNKILRNFAEFIRKKHLKLSWKYGKYLWKTYRYLQDNYKKIEIKTIPQIETTQVKEKFGGLRFYTNDVTEEQHAIISWAESLSYHICEYCGTTENIGITQGWLSTICKDCYSKIENRKDLIWKPNETN
jgi:hypothetical protein